MILLGFRRALLALAILALAVTGSAAAADDDGRGIDPNQGRSLVEVTLPNKAAAIRLQLADDSYGIDFNDHYLRTNADGTVTVTVFGTADELAASPRCGLRPRHDDRRARKRGVTGSPTGRADVKAEEQADAAALGETVGTASHEDEIVVLRVDYFENYAGRFLSVEAKDRLGGATPTGSTYVGPTPLAFLEHRRGHADQLDAAGDERQHRPGYDAGHLHRASRARAHRRRRQSAAAAADDDPDRLEHRSVHRGSTCRSGSAAACRR